MGIQLTLAARYLWGRKLRTFLTTLAIIFGVLVIFGMNILLPTMLAAFQGNLLNVAGQADLVITHESNDSFSPRVLDRVEEVQGIRAASGSLERVINIPANFFREGSVGALTLIGLEPKAAQQIRDYSVAQGRWLTSSDTNSAVITQGLADSIKVQLGDELPLPTPQGTVRLKIVGIRAAQTLPGNEPVWVTLSEAQKLLNQSARINTIEAKLDSNDTAQRDAVSNAVSETLGDEYQLGGLAGGSELLASLQTSQQAFNLLGFLALFMGGFIIFNTFRTIVTERRHDIGMLRAIGAARNTIIGLFLVEGLVQGVIGTVIGMGFGYLIGLGAVSGMSGYMQSYLHVQIGAPVIEPSLVVVTLALGIGVTLVSGLLPAWNASRVPPLEALRPAAAEVESSRRISSKTIAGIALIVLAAAGLVVGNISLVALGGLLFLIGLVLIAPALVKPIARVLSALLAFAFAREGTAMLAEGNLVRQPSRAAITASATMIGLAIIVATVGLLSSMTGSIGDILARTLGSDYLLVPPSIGTWSNDIGADDTLADRLRAVYGVRAVSTLRFASSSINDKTVNVLGIDPESFQQVSGLNFSEGDAQSAYQQLTDGRALILNGITATQLGVHPGDTVKVSSPEGEQLYRVAAIGSDLLNTKILTAYLSQNNLKRDFHKTEDVFLQIDLASNADRAQVEERIRDIASHYPQFKLISGQAYLNETMALYSTSFTMLYVLLAILALPSLIAILNTLAIGVIERTREIGMLRAIGATRGQVRRTILVEALLLAAIGTAFGLVAGVYLGYVLVAGIGASGIMQLHYSFPYAGILVAVAAGLLFGVIAAIIPARQAAKMDIIQALRYE